MFSKKGQGTIEYLVIIAIVVVIALVVVGLLLQIMGQGSGVPETASQAAWKSASPFGIIDWSRTASPNVITLVLKNNSADMLDLNRVTIGSDYNNQLFSNIASGQTVRVQVTLTNTGACVANSKYAIPKENISITYNTATIQGHVKSGVFDLVGTCQ